MTGRLKIPSGLSERDYDREVHRDVAEKAGFAPAAKPPITPGQPRLIRHRRREAARSNPRWISHKKKKAPCTAWHFSFWRRRRDSNPRAAHHGNTISSRARYDHFDTSPACLLKCRKGSIFANKSHYFHIIRISPAHVNTILPIIAQRMRAEQEPPPSTAQKGRKRRMPRSFCVKTC